MQAECKAYIIEGSLFQGSSWKAQHFNKFFLKSVGHFWGNLSIVQRYDRYACDPSHNDTFVTDPLVAWTKEVFFFWMGQWQDRFWWHQDVGNRRKQTSWNVMLCFESVSFSSSEGWTDSSSVWFSQLNWQWVTLRPNRESKTMSL